MMPTTSEVSIDAPSALNKEEPETHHDDSKDLKSSEIQHKKKQHSQSGSPKRKFGNHRGIMSGNRQNRNHSANKKVQSDNNNNNGSYTKQYTFKGSSNSTHPKIIHNDFHQLANNQTSDTSKKASHKYRSITKTSQTYHYEDLPLHQSPMSDAQSLPPFSAEFHGESAKQTYKGQPSNLKSSESEHLPRKYSMDFLNQVGYKMNATGLNLPAQPSPKTPKRSDDSNLMALKMALGDNSNYYTHFYASSMYGNQMMLNQQYHTQNYSRYQQQQEMQRIQRMYPRGQQENYQRVYQPSVYVEPDSPSLKCQCPPSATQQYNRGFHQQSYSQSQPTYQHRPKGERREHHENPKKSRSNYGFQNGTDGERFFKKEYKDTYKNRYQLSKSSSFSEEFAGNRKQQGYKPVDHVFRSLSPTPPNSSKSSSPSAHDKLEKEATTSAESNLELVDDSLSNASSSGPSSYTEVMKASRSAPVLLVPEEPAKNVNLWINNNFGSAYLNGLSLSAEHLSVKDTPISIIKRPPSANGIKKNTQTFTKFFNNLSYDPQYPFEYYLSRSEESEVRSIPSGLKCNSPWNQLSEQMWEKFMVSQQSQETYTKKMLVWKGLHNAMKNFPIFHQKAFPKWGLYLVGSTISGFGSDTSDVDMCLFSKGNYPFDSRADPRMEAMVTLNELKNYLTESMSSFQHFSLINAKVPILRFRDPSNQIEIDLNYNNCVGVRNTQLLFSYSQLDWRLRPLALIVKLWAHYHNINDARNSTISSYSLVLMVIHFLQCAVSPAILPCLHKLCPDKFRLLHDITTIDMVETVGVKWQSENRQPLGELFLRFLDYYSNFDYNSSAISVRTGGVLPIEECKLSRSVKNDPNHWLTLCIEEPFDLTNTARSAYDFDIFTKIKEVFFKSWLRLKETRSLDSLFKDPLFTQQLQQYNQMGQKFMIPNGSSAPLNDVKS